MNFETATSSQRFKLKCFKISIFRIASKIKTHFKTAKTRTAAKTHTGGVEVGYQVVYGLDEKLRFLRCQSEPLRFRFLKVLFFEITPLHPFTFIYIILERKLKQYIIGGGVGGVCGVEIQKVSRGPVQNPVLEGTKKKLSH